MRIGALGISAAALPGVDRITAAEASLGASKLSPATAQSVILLWMAGGVTQFESFDPKPDAPEEVRGTLSTIDTRLPGVRFAEVLPCLSAISDRLAVVRSYSHDNNDHFLSQVFALSGRKVTRTQLTSEPNVGAVVSHLHGPRNQLPAYIAVPGITRPGPPPHNLFVGGWLGAEHAPFAIGGEPAEPDFTAGPEKSANPPGDIPESLRPQALEFLSGLDLERIGGRAQLLRELETQLRSLRAIETTAVESQYRHALQLLSSTRVRAAFDLGNEPDAVRERYGRTKLGGRCLMARRLVEAGARFVMVDYGYDPDYGNLWDNHCTPAQRQPHISEMAKRPYHLVGMDRAFAALVSDLEERGLLDSTLVVFMTEFGRTPKINPAGGRDHWGMAGSIFFAGGGTRAGQVIGETDRQGAYPTGRGYTPADVAATIYRAVGIDPETRIYDRQNRPAPVLPEGRAIAEIL